MVTNTPDGKRLVRTLRLRDAKTCLSAVVEAAERGEATTITKYGERDAGGGRAPGISGRPAEFCCSVDAHSPRRGDRARCFTAPRSRFVTGWLLDTNVLSDDPLRSHERVR